MVKKTAALQIEAMAAKRSEAIDLKRAVDGIRRRRELAGQLAGIGGSEPLPGAPAPKRFAIRIPARRARYRFGGHSAVVILGAPTGAGRASSERSRRRAVDRGSSGASLPAAAHCAEAFSSSRFPWKSTDAAGAVSAAMPSANRGDSLARTGIGSPSVDSAVIGIMAENEPSRTSR